MPPIIFVLLLEGKANFKGCGTVIIPSAEAMAQAGHDTIDPIQAIRKIDMTRGMTNLMMPPNLFVLLLKGEADFLKTCGITVTMPSAEAMAQADPDIIQRFQAITKIDLHYDQYRESHENNLAGELALIPPPSSSSPPTLHPHHRQHPSFQRHAYYQVGPEQLLAAHW